MARHPESFLYWTASFAALNSVNLGYDIGVNSGIGFHLKEGSLHFTDLQVETFMVKFKTYYNKKKINQFKFLLSVLY